jgi:UDP-glucose 4-epimerase
MVRVSIIGGFGFIGHHLAIYLSSLGYEITLFGRPAHKDSIGQFPRGTQFVFGDCANAVELEPAVAGANVVFHLVGNTVPASSNANPRFDVDAHVGPTITLLELCVRHGVDQVVFTSSGGTVYGIPCQVPIPESHPVMPISSYGIQKATIEHYLRLFHYLHGLRSTVLRISNPYGPGQNIARLQGLVGTVCDRILKHGVLEVWGDGSVVRDYIYIHDLLVAMAKVIGQEQGASIYNVGSGLGTSVNDVLNTFVRLGINNLTVKYQPARKVDVPVNVLDIRRFSELFSWEPETKLIDGIRTTFLALGGSL